MLSSLILLSAFMGSGPNPSSCQVQGQSVSPDEVAGRVSSEIGVGMSTTGAEEVLRKHCLEFSYAARSSFVNFGFKPKDPSMAGLIYALVKGIQAGDVIKSYQILIAIDTKGLVTEVKVVPIYTGP
jgi:hypothetical protein